MRIFLTSVILWSLVYSGFSQEFNCNQIRNWDFQNGPGWGHAGYDYAFDTEIDFWRSAAGSPDWYDLNMPNTSNIITQTLGLSTSNFPSLKFIRIAYGSYYEAIKCVLPRPLESGKIYQYRYFASPNDNKVDRMVCEQIVFSNGYSNENSSNCWNSSSYKITTAASCCYGSKLNPGWYEKIGLLSVPDSYNNKIKNVIIKAGDAGMGGSLYIDNFELYEYCPTELLFENQKFQYQSNQPYEGQRILAGYNVGNTVLGNGNVIIGSTAKVTFKGIYEVLLEPGFETEDGAEFLSYLAPCGADEFPLPTPKQFDICLNRNDQTTISFNDIFNPDYHYHWTPTTYLTNPNSYLTQVNIPQMNMSGNNYIEGSLVYYLHVTDNNGNEVISPVQYKINYSEGLTLVFSPPTMYCPTPQTPMRFITTGVQRYKFKVLSAENNTQNVLGSYSEENNIPLFPSNQTIIIGYIGKDNDGNWMEMGTYLYTLELFNNCNEYSLFHGTLARIKNTTKSIRKIVDMQGRIVYESNSDNLINYIDIGLKPGMYLLMDVNGENEVTTKKIIINE